MVLLVVGTANHCFFEDFFSLFSKIVFGTEELQHLPNHLGSNTSHKHDDSTESHEHGQPHPVIAIRFEKASSDFLMNLLATILSVYLLVACTFGFSVIKIKTDIIVPFTIADPPGFIRKFISSLTLAPQAPPI